MELHCDASASEFGAILLQQQARGQFRPISYFSLQMTPAEFKYSNFELECLAAIYAIKRFYSIRRAFSSRSLQIAFVLPLANKISTENSIIGNVSATI